jgi:hypothetical protein
MSPIKNLASQKSKFICSIKKKGSSGRYFDKLIGLARIFAGI